MSGFPDEMVGAHELGHAIAARECGVPIGEIRAFSPFFSFSNQLTGYCTLRSMRVKCDAEGMIVDKRWEGLLIMTAAGQVASEHWYRLHDLPMEETAGTDRVLFAEDAALMENPLTWDEAAEKARHIIVACWAEIVELTPELLERGRMSRGQVA